MIQLHFFRAFTFLIFLGFIISTHISIAQTLGCGTPDMTVAQRDSILQQAVPPDTIATVAASSPWKIPVWFYHLRRTDGSSDQQNVDAYQVVDGVNQYFNGLFEFRVCGTTNIDNDDYIELDLGSPVLDDLWDEVFALNMPLSDNCIRVFLLGDGPVYTGGAGWNGYAHAPFTHGAQAAIYIQSVDPRIWAHEFGHYFGLMHTYANPQTQYVDNEVYLGGIKYTCEHLGDGICDTPAEVESCSFNSGDCELQFCIPALDPLGVAYDPDPTFLMGDMLSCWDKFSGDQKQVMRALYLYASDYAAIRNPPLECVIPKYGHLEKNCEDFSGATPDPFPIDPLVNFQVELRDGPGNICPGQDNLTDTLGRFLTMPCTLTSNRHHVLPDRQFGNPLDGVSPFDIVLIQKHILGLGVFQSPFQMIAADANNSGGISPFDIVTLQRLILGIDSQFPNGINWRYVPKLCTSDNQFLSQFNSNPFNTTYLDPFIGTIRGYSHQGAGLPNSKSWMDHVTLDPASSFATEENSWSFTGVKVGDVNCSVILDNYNPGGENHTFLIDSTSDIGIQNGHSKRIQVIASAPSKVVAWQFGARYDSGALSFLEIAPGSESELFDEDNFHYSPADSAHEYGQFRAIWYSEDGETWEINHKVLFEIGTTATGQIDELVQAFQLDSTVLPFLFYDEDGEEIPDVTLTLRITSDSTEFRSPGPGTIPNNEEDRPSIKVRTYPVPFTSELGFFFDLPETEIACLRLFNNLGEQVKRVDMNLPAGLQDIRVADLSILPKGLYWYILEAGRYNSRGKLSKQ